MNLAEAIAATGMTPPRSFVCGRWLRFPGIGKSRSNRSGWCRVISPTLAVFGDWSSGFTQVWKDEQHREDARSLQALRDAQERERRFAREEREKQARVAREAQSMISRAIPWLHPYLARKGFHALTGLTLDGKLVVPVMDFEEYPNVISAQLIDEAGDKKFLPGGRTKSGVLRLGMPPNNARRILICEGYATGLSLQAACRLLQGQHCIFVCFSAYNLERIARLIPSAFDPVVCADNDRPNKVTGEKAGEEAAKRTGKRWIMPSDVGQDWNDVHVSQGLRAVVEAIRTA